MTASKVFLYFSLSFVSGILISSFLVFTQPIALGLLILSVFLASVFWERKRFVFVGFCLLFLVLGVMRHQQAVFQAPEIKEGETSFMGRVSAEPDVRENHTNLTLTVDSVPGKILASVDRYPEYNYNDKLKVSGEIKKPGEFEGFNYPDYLAKDGVYSVMYFPEIELLGKSDRGSASVIYGSILQVKNRLRESINTNLSEPQGSLLAALILGDKRRLSQDTKEKLNAAGLRHITAVSGLHVMILAGVFMSFGLFLGFSRKLSFYLTLIFLILFIVLVGLPSSAVRAGIMASFFLLAQIVGRPNSGLRAVVLAASIMLLINPLLLRSDVGFQLSFLAVLGIACFMNIFKRYLKSSVLSLTLSAQVFTLPILIYNFGYFSLASPLTNILVVPLLPFTMILGFISAVAGMVFSPLGFVLSWPVWLLLSYIIKVAELASSLSLVLHNVHFVWLSLFYLFLGLLAFKIMPRMEKNVI